MKRLLSWASITMVLLMLAVSHFSYAQRCGGGGVRIGLSSSIIEKVSGKLDDNPSAASTNDITMDKVASGVNLRVLGFMNEHR